MVTWTSVWSSSGAKLMRPVCFGPLKDFHPIDWPGTTLVICASHWNCLPSMFTDHRDCAPKRSIFLTKSMSPGRCSKFDHASKTACTGRPMLMLFSGRKMWLSVPLDRRLNASSPPMPANVPNAAPAANPGQNSSRLMRHSFVFVSGLEQRDVDEVANSGKRKQVTAVGLQFLI